MAQTKDLLAALKVLDPSGEGFIEMEHDVMFLPGPRPGKMDPALLKVEDGGPDDWDGADPDDPYAGREVSLAGGEAHWSSEYDCWVMY